MNYQNIKCIIGYEIKILTRDWGVRLITIFGFFLTAFLHVMAQSNWGNAEWVAYSIPSAIPFANAYLFNCFQVVVIVFWAGRFIRHDKQEDTFDTVSIRPYSNTDYLCGKTLGFLFVLLILNVLWSVGAFLIHVCVSNSPFSIVPYLFYILTLTLPVLVFTTGLVSWTKGIVQNQVITFIVLGLFFYFSMMYGREFFHGMLDLFSLSFPNVFSDIIGFSGLDTYLWQRCALALFGCGLIVFSVYSINRLPNTPRQYYVVNVLGGIILLLGMYCFWNFNVIFWDSQGERTAIREVFIKYEGEFKVQVVSHDIQFKQEGCFYMASSQLAIVNPHKQGLARIILYLNPGLEITTIVCNNRPLKFARERQVVVIDYKLQPGERINLQMQYHGHLVQEVCYAEFENFQSQADSRSFYLYNLGRDFFYLNSYFTLLTPECLWYPSGLPPVYIHAPYLTPQNFTRFQLTVVGEKERIPISQGLIYSSGDTTRFINREAQTGLSLCIGKYKRGAITLDGTLFEIYLFKGHEYLTAGFDNPHEIAEDWLLGHSFYDQGYNFEKLALVESPIHFCGYRRFWKTGSEYIQPGIIFRPEREALIPFELKVDSVSINEGMTTPQLESFLMYKRNYQQTRRVLTGNLFIDAFSNRHNSVEMKNEYDISPLLEKYHFYISSTEFPGINLIFQKMQTCWKMGYQSFKENMRFVAPIQRLKEYTLENMLQTPQDDLVFERVLYGKTIAYLRRILCSVAYEDFYDFTQAFIRRHVFQEVSYETYCLEFQARFGVNLVSITRQLYSEQGLPVFLIRDVKIQMVENMDRQLGYVVCVKVWNKGQTDGVITLATPSPNFDKHYLIPAGSCKEIRSYFPGKLQKNELDIQTNMALNLPAYYFLSDIKLHAVIKDPCPGVFDADTALFRANSDEYIVDNGDLGFRIVETGRELTKRVKKTGYFAALNLDRWVLDYDSDSYGEPGRDYYKKKNGQGDSDVEWNVQLPEAGEYEVFIYNNERLVREYVGMKFLDGKKIETKDPTQTYKFTHRKGEEKIVLDLRNVESGWISLGKYCFLAGPSKVTLLDRGEDQHQVLFADAVKWVKVK